MTELLFLLLPLAVLYGYAMGKGSLRLKRQNNKNIRNVNYLKGFDYLLNNQREKAVDKFITYLNESDDPSFASNLALGNLFRRRGEVDKAIAVHENLSQKKELDESDQEIALLELARDFIGAGLFDRAEKILQQLVDVPRQRQTASGLLLKVYEREQDYSKAIDVALKFRDILGGKADLQLAEYYCEKAKSLNLNGKKLEAKGAYRYALDVFPKSVRARLELADLQIDENKFSDAYNLVREASALQSDFGMLCLERVKKCFPNSADPNYRIALEDLVHKTGSAEAMVELVRTVEQNSGIADAQQLLLSFIRSKPNLKLFSAMMDLRLHLGEPDPDDSLKQLKSLVDAQISANPRYTCTNCGFESGIRFWQCPSCRKWESLKPKRGLDGD